MPNWLYIYFAEVVAPIIFAKKGRNLVRSPNFDTHANTPSFWLYPPEPVSSLSQKCFNPVILYGIRVFLWLPHFYVDELRCPRCRGILEKNGALAPRRVCDTDSNYEIVAWGYYCRKGCRSHFHGWSREFLASLPAWLRLAFPAVLSHNSGLSRNVVSMLRVSNQHKMGPNGFRSLLLETHTQRFSILQAQYLEAVFELVNSRQGLGDPSASQTTLHNHFLEHIPSFGDFGDPQGYAGFVPSEHYLTDMLNKSIERDEHDANQHTACLAPDQISIDDSHKVGYFFGL